MMKGQKDSSNSKRVSLRKYAEILEYDFPNGPDKPAVSHVYGSVYPLLQYHIGEIAKETLLSTPSAKAIAKITGGASRVVYYPGSGSDLLAPFYLFDCDLLVAVNIPDPNFYQTAFVGQNRMNDDDFERRGVVKASGLFLNTALYSIIHDTISEYNYWYRFLRNGEWGPMSKIDVGKDKVVFEFTFRGRRRIIHFYYNSNYNLITPPELPKNGNYLMYLHAAPWPTRNVPKWLAFGEEDIAAYPAVANHFKKRWSKTMTYVNFYRLLKIEEGASFLFRYMKKSSKDKYLQIDLLKNVTTQENLQLFERK